MSDSSNAAEWRGYEVYRPRVEKHWVVNADKHRLKYNHDSSVAWFEDRWICLWNANETPKEGAPGQLNYWSTSRDGKTWSEPQAVFADPRCSENVVPCPEGSQWQPNLIVVDGELWAIWSQKSKDGFHGCYWSRLKRPNGKWENFRLLWDGDPHVDVNGTAYRLFPSQNPFQLRSGRVLCPVVMHGPEVKDAPVQLKWKTEKRDSVIYTDDNGQTWHCSPGTIQPDRPWAQWEPTVWEEADGTVRMLARNQDNRSIADGGPGYTEFLIESHSSDGGATWTPHEVVPVVTIICRMHVLPFGSDRFVMVHNDAPAHSRKSWDRLNIAMWFKRGAGVDFAPGPGLTGDDNMVAYPHMWPKGNMMVMSYSVNNSKSVKVAHVSPLPDPRKYYLLPRDNTELFNGPQRRLNRYLYDGQRRLDTWKPVEMSTKGFSLSAWVQPNGPCVVFDTREAKGGGVVWAIDDSDGALLPRVSMATDKGKPIDVQAKLELRTGKWNYFGATVDPAKGQVVFHVNDQSETVEFKGDPTLKGGRGALGHPSIEDKNGPGGLDGEITLFVCYAEALLDEAEHRWLHNQRVPACRKEPLKNDKKPEAEATLWLQPDNPEGNRNYFQLEEGRVEQAKAHGADVLRFVGEGSASVEVDENHRDRGDRVRLKFRGRIESGAEHVLCTVGDADTPARIVHRAGKLRIVAGDCDEEVGGLTKDDWFEVEVVSGQGRTTVTLANGPSASVDHDSYATWVFLGRGYRIASGSPRREAARLPLDSVWVVDTDSVRSCVESD